MKKTKILVFVLLVALCLSCFAACNKTPKELVDARDYLYNQYKEFDGKATPADFNRVGAVMINGTKYPIEWTVEVKTEGQSESVKVVKNEDGTVTVDVDEKAAVEISYDLTATISNAKGKTITVTFHHTVPQFKELTYAEYYATEAGKTVVVKGVITAIISKERGNTVNGFYMQDQDGGYYVYGMVSGQTPESLGLKVGMTVRAAGEKDIYNGTHEIKDAGVEILDETITAVTPADYTEIFTKAAKLSDEALTAKQSTVVTLKGVTVKENGGSDGSYYYFELAGKKSYVRISSSACPLTKDEITAFKAGFESSFGKVGNVTGIISLYDGSFYLTPISGTPFTDLQLPVLSDADAVAFEKGALTFMSLIGYDGSYDLVVITSYIIMSVAKVDKDGIIYNIVGFQTNLRYGEQKRVFSMIPGLQNAEFVKYGVMHRNTYINSTKLLDNTYCLKKNENVFFAGQITGVEGYVESISSGMVAAINACQKYFGKEKIIFSETTMLGALAKYISTENDKFQPMNANFGIVPELNEKIRDKKLKYGKLADRGIADLKKL